MIMFTGNLDSDMASFFQNLFAKQARKEYASVFPPDTRVRFKGSLRDLLPYVSAPDEAKAILYDGGIGQVIGSNDFDEGKFYIVDFGDVGYHNHAIPEHLLEKI